MNYEKRFNKKEEKEKWEAKAKEYMNDKVKAKSLLDDARKKAERKKTPTTNT